MRLSIAFSLLSLSLMAAGQVVTNGGYATTAPGMGQNNPPLIATPTAALPGQGSAQGAPLQEGVNDARTGGTGSVFIPTPVVQGTGNTPNNESTSSAPNAINPSGMAPSAVPGEAMNPQAKNQPAGQPVNIGMQQFTPASRNGAAASAQTAAATPLGDIARQYKTQSAGAHPRVITNDTIAALESNNGGMAMNTAQPLDRNDMADVNAALRRNKGGPNPAVASNANVAAAAAPTVANANAAAEYNRMSQEAAESSTQAQNNPPAAGENATMPQVNQQPENSNAKAAAPVNGNARANRLPASSSPLPLIALLGAIAVSGGLAMKYFRS
jgi:hypothetical protein